MTAPDQTPQQQPSKISPGGRNLVILGLGAITIALITTSVSLFVYHNSGDIYLDRSRPGYLPEESEVDAETTSEDYEFSDSGSLDAATLQDYLDHIAAPINDLKSLQDPYPADSLSNESLGIPNS